MEEIKKEIKIYIETNENMTTPNLWDSVKAVLHYLALSNVSLPQETREKSNK